ncbi:uncharacterized protein LOC135830502 isoform X1 [Sycon ciliatum]|uniref:uncharacterized protein LOC135830502 isoform X1 n=1 Tax=Sycon ciliatum TaxID=27933 RepID=UPI0031F709BD
MQQTRFVPLVSLICIATVMFIFWTSRVLSKCSQRSTLAMVRERSKVREQRIAAEETVSDSLEESPCFSVWELLNSEYELMHIPSFSYDESIYIFSTAMSVREQSVYIMLPNTAAEQWPMKHNFKSQFSCSFGSEAVSQEHNYTPAQRVDEVDGHYYVLICRIPQPLLECVIQRSGVQQASKTYMAMCLIVNLHIQSNVSEKEQRVPPLIARFKVCQPKQHRRDYLALCAQPITSRVSCVKSTVSPMSYFTFGDFILSMHNVIRTLNVSCKLHVVVHVQQVFKRLYTHATYGVKHRR